ncbi:hypothetical protein CASFOL_021710 [Castilleja foliolosa]|uniref:Jacalin-type lectin domain-containing protein n=1 Tax=Castilleja foliolosa TaxID=1961234 RepID=A0ABD3CXC6_9LAMI
MSDNFTFIKIGPAGCINYGHIWDAKGCDKIAQIFICHDNEINSIQFQYVENGTMLLSQTFGHNNGCNFDVVKLNYPTEYITWISGSYSSINLCSIRFGTNSGEYGPFGQSDIGKEFKFRLGENQFGGFHGNANSKGLKSIGVYLKPNTTLDYKVNKNIVKFN